MPEEGLKNSKIKSSLGSQSIKLESDLGSFFTFSVKCLSKMPEQKCFTVNKKGINNKGQFLTGLVL